MKRSQAREIAIQLGFSVAAAGPDPAAAVEAFFEPAHYASLREEGELYAEKPSPKDMDFITESVTGAAERREELDGYIGKYAKGWRTERISRTAAAVLRQAMYEILYMPDIPPAASMDEAVELIKGYEDQDVVAFVNGVLGGFYRGEVLREDEPAPAPAEPDASSGEEADA